VSLIDEKSKALGGTRVGPPICTNHFIVRHARYFHPDQDFRGPIVICVSPARQITDETVESGEISRNKFMH
jgi:hypothetical protein